jgi:hypothetical protein
MLHEPVSVSSTLDIYRVFHGCCVHSVLKYVRKLFRHQGKNRSRPTEKSTQEKKQGDAEDHIMRTFIICSRHQILRSSSQAG